MSDVETSDNLIGGISIREDAAGSLVSSITRAASAGNAGHGIDFDENRATAADAGDLTATVTDSTVVGQHRRGRARRSADARHRVARADAGDARRGMPAATPRAAA